MTRVVIAVAGTFATVVHRRYGAHMDSFATCVCGWRGTGWCDNLELAKKDARNHVCEQKRPCSEYVRERIVGCTPPSFHRRPCKRYAMPGSKFCRTHEVEE